MTTKKVQFEIVGKCIVLYFRQLGLQQVKECSKTRALKERVRWALAVYNDAAKRHARDILS